MMRGTPMRASMGALASWSASSPSTRTKSAIASTAAATTNGFGAMPKNVVEEVAAALVKREKNGSTGFGKGVAVPHVKHPKVKKMAAAVGRSVGGIDFSALDNQPVYSVVLLLSPENQPQQHLQA